MLACRNNYVYATKLLLENGGCDVKGRYRSDDITLVKHACDDNVVEMVSLLVVHKALSDKEEMKRCRKIADKDPFKVYISEF